MTSVPNCFMRCKFFKDNISSCEKYKQIPEDIANGKKTCKEYKKEK